MKERHYQLPYVLVKYVLQLVIFIVRLHLLSLFSRDLRFEEIFDQFISRGKNSVRLHASITSRNVWAWEWSEFQNWSIGAVGARIVEGEEGCCQVSLIYWMLLFLTLSLWETCHWTNAISVMWSVDPIELTLWACAATQNCWWSWKKALTAAYWSR